MPHLAAAAVLQQGLRGEWLGDIFRIEGTLASMFSGWQGEGGLRLPPQIVGYHMPVGFSQRLWFGKVPVLELIKKKEEREDEAKGNSLQSVNFLICSNSTYP